MEKLKNKAYEIRKKMLKMCIDGKKGHVTSCFSCIEILVALYYGKVLRYDPKNPDWVNRDRFILSKGQASPALYTILANLGFYDEKELKKFNKLGGMFGVHLQKDVPGVELTVGSLGQGFGIAAGMALGAKLNNKLYNVYALLGDGECYEGSIWETAMFVSHHKLNNLITIVDRNYLCVTDFTENLVALEPFEKKWESFGFNVIQIDGHSFKEIIFALNRQKRKFYNKPIIIIANTIKGYGVKSLCYDPIWHGAAPPPEMEQICFKELEENYNNE